MQNSIRPLFIIFIVHGILGFISSESALFTNIWGILTVFIGLYYIVMNRNEGELAAMFAAYIVGLEVLLRMNGDLFHELGKYTVIVFLLAGMFVEKRPNYIPRQFLLFLLLLLPALTVVEFESFDYARKRILFNLSGPVCLAVSAIYFYNRQMSSEQFRRILASLLIPIVTLGIVLYFKTPDYDQIIFTTESNYKTSGGFGPNQVATIIGLGLFVVLFLFVNGASITGYRILDLLIVIFLSFRGLITFSRGGLMVALVSIVFAILLTFLMKPGRVSTLRSMFFPALLVILAVAITWNYTNNVTSGVLKYRYYGQNTNNTNEFETYSTGRLRLIETEIETFYDFPILGRGVGMMSQTNFFNGKYFYTSHTEFTRLLSEHGLYGLGALLILVLSPLNYSRRLSRTNKVLLFSFILFAWLSMLHSAMRLAAPGFIYGLSFLITDEK